MSAFDRVERYRDDIIAGRAIALIWQVDDIIARASERGIDLTDTEAEEILYSLGRRHDPCYGVTWTTIDVYTDMTVGDRE